MILSLIPLLVGAGTRAPATDTPTAPPSSEDEDFEAAFLAALTRVDEIAEAAVAEETQASWSEPITGEVKPGADGSNREDLGGERMVTQVRQADTAISRDAPSPLARVEDTRGVTQVAQVSPDVERVSRSLQRLDPELRSKVERVIARMAADFGHEVELVEGYRTPERQAHLFEQGRSRSGPVVTWTRESAHTDGRAADLRIDGGYDDIGAYSRLQFVAREEGLVTLGMSDRGHMELAEGQGSRAFSVSAEQSEAPETRREKVAPSRNGVATVARTARVAAVARVARVARPGAPTRRAALSMPQQDIPEAPARFEAPVLDMDDIRGAEIRAAAPPTSKLDIAVPRLDIAVPQRDILVPQRDILVPQLDIPAARAQLEAPGLEMGEIRSAPIRGATPPAPHPAAAAPQQAITVPQEAVPEARVPLDAPTLEMGEIRSAPIRGTTPPAPRPAITVPQQAITAPEQAMPERPQPFNATALEVGQIDGARGAMGETRQPAAASTQSAALAAAAPLPPGATGADSQEPRRDSKATDREQPTEVAPDVRAETRAAALDLLSRTIDGAIAPAQPVREVGSADPLQRVERVLEAQELARSFQPGRVTLRLDDSAGTVERVRVGLLGNSVDAQIDVTDAATAQLMRSRADELRVALESRGLELGALGVTTPSGVDAVTEGWLGTRGDTTTELLRALLGGSAADTGRGDTQRQRDLENQKTNRDEAASDGSRRDDEKEEQE